MDPDLPPPVDLPKPLERSGSDSSLSSPRDLPPPSETPTSEKVDKVVNPSGKGSKSTHSGSKSDLRPTTDSNNLRRSSENLQNFAAETSAPASPRTRMGEPLEEPTSNPLDDEVSGLSSINQPNNLQESGEVRKKRQPPPLIKTTYQRIIQSRHRTSSAPSSSPSSAPLDVGRMRSSSGSTNYDFVQIPDETPRSNRAFSPSSNILNIPSETIEDDIGESTGLSAITGKEKKESAPLNSLKELQKLAKKLNDPTTNKEITRLLKKSKPDKGKINELISTCLLNIRQKLLNNESLSQEEKNTVNMALLKIGNYIDPPKLEELRVTEDKYYEALFQLKVIIDLHYK